MIGLRKSGIVLVLTALAACASPDVFVSPNAPVASADVQRIYLATDRVLADDLSRQTWADRSSDFKNSSNIPEDAATALGKGEQHSWPPCRANDPTDRPPKSFLPPPLRAHAKEVPSWVQW